MKSNHDKIIENLVREAGFDHFGFCVLSNPETMSHYQSWLQKQYHGSMSYLERHAEKKNNPALVLPNAKVAIVVGQPYHPPPTDHPFLDTFKSLKVAKYAQGEDYHHWFKEKLEHLETKLKSHFTNAHFFSSTDSGPILERDWARQAGLGWIGKNTCLIHEKRGSFFFIGEILTDLNFLDSDNSSFKKPLAPDRCGTCTQCIDACPTGALEAPHLLNAKKCISYLNIEAKTVAALELRKGVKDWYFGCDICQDVCPWNQKRERQLGLQKEPQKQQQKVENHQLIKELANLLSLSDEELKSVFKNSALMRAKPWQHRRNAIIVAANLRFQELKEKILIHRNDERLAELCEWALTELDAPKDR